MFTRSAASSGRRRSASPMYPGGAERCRFTTCTAGWPPRERFKRRIGVKATKVPDWVLKLPILPLEGTAAVNPDPGEKTVPDAFAGLAVDLWTSITAPFHLPMQGNVKGGDNIYVTDYQVFTSNFWGEKISGERIQTTRFLVKYNGKIGGPNSELMNNFNKITLEPGISMQEAQDFYRANIKKLEQPRPTLTQCHLAVGKKLPLPEVLDPGPSGFVYKFYAVMKSNKYEEAVQKVGAMFREKRYNAKLIHIYSPALHGASRVLVYAVIITT